MQKQIVPFISIYLFFFACAANGYETEHRNMVIHQIEKRGISDPATLSAMRTVPRHLFVPESLQASAYEDRPLPIGYGQTISQPYVVAFMTEVIGPEKGQRVLEIGTGSGYQAVVLAEIVDMVYTVEIIPQLASQAEKRMKAMSCSNVMVKNSDGYYGWEEFAPYDAIVVTAAAEYVPPPLIRQLKEGGKIIIPVGSPFMTQQLMLITRKGDQMITQTLFPVRFVPFTRSDGR